MAIALKDTDSVEARGCKRLRVFGFRYFLGFHSIPIGSIVVPFGITF